MNSKINMFTQLNKFQMFASAVLLYMLMPVSVYAEQFSTGDDLTVLFHTRGFMGNAEVLSKLNWVGALVSSIISVSCFIGLALTVIRIMFSLLYLSARNLFDTVHEVKQAGNGGGGIKDYLSGFGKVFGSSAQKTSGLDTIVIFILSLLPDIKYYSDFGDESKMPNGLKEDDGVTQYILKISLGTILSIFFFSIGWNGVLWQAYGSVVNGLGVAAERLVTDEFAVAIDDWLNTGKAYSVNLTDGTERGKFRQKLVKDAISKTNRHLNKSHKEADILHAIGSWIEKRVCAYDSAELLKVATGTAHGVNTTTQTDTTKSTDIVDLQATGKKVNLGLAEILAGHNSAGSIDTNGEKLDDGNGNTITYRGLIRCVTDNSTYDVYTVDPVDTTKDDWVTQALKHGHAAYLVSNSGSTTDIPDTNWKNLTFNVNFRRSAPEVPAQTIDPSTLAFVDYFSIKDIFPDRTDMWKFDTENGDIYIVIYITKKANSSVDYLDKTSKVPGEVSSEATK